MMRSWSLHAVSLSVSTLRSGVGLWPPKLKLHLVPPSSTASITTGGDTLVIGLCGLHSEPTTLGEVAPEKFNQANKAVQPTPLRSVEILF
jgi:hypothetical protein